MAFGTQDDTDEVMNEINMTPFVDVMLVLLIIFIITVPVMKHAVNVDLPRASSQREDAKPETVRLSVQADGTYYWNESKVTDEALPGLLRCGHGLGHALVAHVAVAADVQVGLGAFLPRGLQARGQLFVAQGLVVQPIRAVGLDRQAQRLRLHHFLFVADARQLHVDGVLHHRHRDDEDDQQHQHHVDERDHVDLAHHVVVLVGNEPGHGFSPSSC